MLVRALVTAAALSVPTEAQAAGYVVQPGDTLSHIAEQAHVSVSVLAQANGIQQPDVLRPGQSLYIPLVSGTAGYPSAQSYTYSSSPSAPSAPAATSYSAPSGSYTVQWGDTLSGLALRYHTSVEALRAANPTLGSYLIAGQSLNLCTTCASVAGTAPGVATAYAGQAPIDSSYQARALITAYAQQYGLDSSFPLAIATQESGFQQTAVSGAGAIGVMQVLPSTARQISLLMGRPVNLYSLDDNIHAGVFWLAHLVNLYGGDERLAAAAYYQGSASLATHGYYDDTLRYVSGAMSLKTGYGG